MEDIQRQQWWTRRARACILGAGVVLLGGSVNAQLRINEIMSSNGSTVADEDGDYSDWVEIVNLGPDPEALLGFGLTDNPSQPYKWTFPDVTLNAGEYLVVWASNKNRTVAGNPLHTNFAIGAEGEEIVLTAPGNITVDSAPERAIPRDISLGRQPDGTGDWFYFPDPTPGGPNTTTGYDEILDPPTFSAEGGFYQTGFNLLLQAPGATVRYTVDGSVPTETSPVLAGPLAITSRAGDPNDFSLIPTNPFNGLYTSLRAMWWRPPAGEVFKGTVVRARAFRDGAFPSATATRTFFVDPNLENRYRLPVVSLSTNREHFFSPETGIYVAGNSFNPNAQFPDRTGNYFFTGDAWERPAHLEFFEEGGIPGFASDVGVRIHGGITPRFPRKSLRIYFRGDYGLSTLEYPLFPGNSVSAFRRLIIRNSGNDSGFEPLSSSAYDEASLFRDALIHRLAAPTGLDIQDSRPAIMFLNGEYWGIHNIRERHDQHKLAIRYNLDPDSIDIITVSGAAEEGNTTAYNALRNYVLNNDISVSPHFEYIESLVDTANLADYYFVQIYSRNTDWPGNNMELWRPRVEGARWRWLLFDVEWFTFNMFNPTGHQDPMIARAINAESVFSSRLIKGLLENPQYRQYFVVRSLDLLNTILEENRVDQFIQEKVATYGPHINEHIDRWRRPTNYGRWFYSIIAARAFAQNRPTFVRQDLAQVFGYSTESNLSVASVPSTGGTFRVNTVNLENNDLPWSGIYFDGLQVEVEAIPAPGHRFIRWLELSSSAGPLHTQTLNGNLHLTAIFEQLPDPELIHYWNFNDTATLLDPTVSILNGMLGVLPGSSTETVPGTGQGFAALNARLGEPAGSHLRVNNPIDAEMLLHLPTTEYSFLEFSYEKRRSGQGAGTQILEYTLNGIDYLPLDSSNPVDGDPVVYTAPLSGIEGANDNPNFGIRIRFEEGPGGMGGNNRFDNIALTGIKAPPMPSATTELWTFY